jgi:hypothetical protein
LKTARTASRSPSPLLRPVVSPMYVPLLRVSFHAFVRVASELVPVSPVNTIMANSDSGRPAPRCPSRPGGAACTKCRWSRGSISDIYIHHITHISSTVNGNPVDSTGIWDPVKLILHTHIKIEGVCVRWNATFDGTIHSSSHSVFVFKGVI